MNWWKQYWFLGDWFTSDWFAERATESDDQCNDGWYGNDWFINHWFQNNWLHGICESTPEPEPVVTTVSSGKVGHYPNRLHEVYEDDEAELVILEII